MLMRFRPAHIRMIIVAASPSVDLTAAVENGEMSSERKTTQQTRAVLTCTVTPYQESARQKEISVTY